MRKKLPPKMLLLKHLPKKYVKKRIMRPMATRANCPLCWIENNIAGKINAFFGSKEKWEKIPDWDHFDIVVDPPFKMLNHGYDESKPDDELTLNDVENAAAFRGGKCLSPKMEPGDLTTKLKWRCADGHEFEASPYLILKTGHWCDACLKPPWRFDCIARSNPFIAQVWFTDHDKNENNIYQ